MVVVVVVLVVVVVVLVVVVVVLVVVVVNGADVVRPASSSETEGAISDSSSALDAIASPEADSLDIELGSNRRATTPKTAESTKAAGATHL